LIYGVDNLGSTRHCVNLGVLAVFVISRYPRFMLIEFSTPDGEKVDTL
jgi:hypothetical protein